MIDVKLSLSIILPGGVMFSREESLKPLKKPVKNNKGKILKKKGETVYKTVLVPSFEKNDSFKLKLKDAGKEVETTVFVRKCKPAKQVINICEEAYEHMISSTEVPYGYKGNWKTLSKNQKIKWHCERIAASLGGTFDSFQVLD